MSKLFTMPVRVSEMSLNDAFELYKRSILSCTDTERLKDHKTALSVLESLIENRLFQLSLEVKEHEANRL